MANSGGRFQKLSEGENQLINDEPEQGVTEASRNDGEKSQMDRSFKDRFFAIKRRNLIIIGTVILIVVLVLFVVSTLVGHYTARAKDSHSSPSASKLQMHWSAWSKWGECSVTCGTGVQWRRRNCMANATHNCVGNNEDVNICKIKECNDDVWLDWTQWSSCKKVSGSCKKSRTRSCHNTALKIQGGRCEGKDVQEAQCPKQACHGYSWAEWKPWSNCSTYCDIGIKKRERLCKDHLGKTVDVSKCLGDNREKEWCHLEDCKDVDECLSNPCQRGTCVDKFKEYECVCEMGWRGQNCEIRESCSSNPCIYGTCIDHDLGYNCTCEGAWGPRCEIPVHDCLDIREAGQRVNGVYSIRLLTTNETVDVLCEMESNGGGWTVFQNRFDGSVNFYQNFDSYKNGFGDKHGEHWLGLRHIYELTRSLTALRIELTAADGSTGYEEFASFRISAEPDYELDISDWSGSTGSKSTGIFYNNRHGFSTYDRDISGRNCAEKDYGGWWFDNCAYANLNGYYGVPGSTGGYNGRQEAAITHRAFKSYQSLKATKMMLRRRSN